MIRDSSLIALKEELSTAIIFFEEYGLDLNLHFNEQVNFKEFQENLECLYHEFTREHRFNLRQFEHPGEIDLYFKMLINVFDLLKNKIGIQPNFVSPHRDNMKDSNGNLEISCIHACADELDQMIIYFGFQKKIIGMAIELIYCSMKEPVYRGADLTVNSKSWESIWFEFNPFKIRLIEDMENISSADEKIRFLKMERKRIDYELRKIGIDSYKPPISVFFDNTLIFLNNLLWVSKGCSSANTSALKWTANRSDFLELMVAFDQSNCISMSDGLALSRKELVKQFGQFLNIDPISDPESRIHKLITRVDRTPFLDSLKKVFTLFSNGEKVKKR
jgi:hypothetical protein